MDTALKMKRDGLPRLLPQPIVLTLAETERVAGGGPDGGAPDGGAPDGGTSDGGKVRRRNPGDPGNIPAPKGPDPGDNRKKK